MRHLEPVPSDPSSPDGSEGASAENDRAQATPDLVRLMRQVARGDEQAFAQVYDATSARVHGVVLRVLRDPSQAEEVTQETFLEAWRQAPRFDPALGSVLTWLLTLAHRRAVDRVRSSEAARRRDEGFGTSHAEVAHDQTAEAAENQVEAQRVRSALASLTQMQREAVTLAYFGGHTHTEVAVLLDLPLGTAKTRIRDGLIRLRDVLGVAR